MATSRRRQNSSKRRSTTNDPASSDTPSPPGTTGRYLVQFRKDSADTGARLLERNFGIRVARSKEFEGTIRTAGLAAGEGMMYEKLATVLVDTEPDRMTALDDGRHSEIVAVEPERIVRASDDGLAPLPPRPAAYSEYARGFRDGVNQIVGRMIDGPAADGFDVAVARALDEAQATWGLQVTNVLGSRFSGQGIRVAVLDTGMDLAHPDFAGRNVHSQSFVTNQTVQDKVGHGTHCIGTACGPRRPTQPPRYGIAFDSEIFVGKVLDNGGSGTDGSILAGIEWAVSNRCQVISMSLGAPTAPGSRPSRIFENVAQRALAAGSLIVAAAGNDSARPGVIAPVAHPANCPSIMAVAAVDSALQIAPFSCGGLNGDGGNVDIAAPGVAVTSSWPRPILRRTISGTSMATPHVAGIAALLAEANPRARGRDLFALLLQTARHLNLPLRDAGAGLVQAP